MQRLRLLSFRSLLVMVPLALLSACAPKESGLRVTVKVRAQGASRVRADCIKLTVSNETQELKSATIKRPTDDDAIFGVRKGSDLPASVKLQASGYIGANCADDANLKLNAQGEVVVANFPESGVTEVEVFVDPPGSSLDADRDGFVAASKGGLDCKDDDNLIFPGAGQVCMNTFDTDCDGQAGCDDSECGTATVCLDPPTRVVVTTSVATMLRYECRGPFRVELQNAVGVRVAIRDTPVALASSLGGVTVHGTSSCGDAAVTSLPILYGQSFFEVYLKADGQAFGDATLTATAAQVATPGTAVVEVHPQPLDHLEFTTPARTVAAGQCSAEVVTVEFRDAQNRRTDVDSPTTITMTSTPGDVGNANIFFSDPACATAGPMGQLLPGQGELSLYVKVSRAGPFTLTATPSAGTAQSQPLTVTPATGAKLAFTNSVIALNTTQSCSAGLFTVQLRDAFDNPVITAADLGVRVSVMGLVNLTFYEPSGNCATAAQTDFVIPAGSSSVSFRARGMTSPPNNGSLQVVVLNGAPITPATQAVNISAGFASKFRLSGSPTNPLSGQCSQNPFSVELLDATDNPAQSAGMAALPFTLSTSPASIDPSFRFYVGPGCVTPLVGPFIVPSGSSSATFSYQGNKAVTSFEIRASSSTLTAPATFLPGNSIRPGPPGKLVFVAPTTQTAQAGACTPGPYVANVLDLNDNVTSFTTPQVVSVGSVPNVGAGVTVGATTCATGNTVALAAGATQTSFTAQHITTGSYALTASVNGFSTAAPATLNVTPGPSTLTFDTPSTGTTVVAGGCQQITLSRRDSFTNNAPVTSAITLGLPPNSSVFSNSTCTASTVPALTNNHTITFWVLVRTAGVHQLTASLVATGQAAVPVSLTVTPGTPTLVFTQPNTDAGTASAAQTAGGCTPVSILRRDPYANDVPLGAAGAVTFGLSGGTTVHNGTPCSMGNVVTTVPVAGTAASASFYVSATVSSPAGGPAVQNVVSQLGAQSATLSLSVSPDASILAMTAPSPSTQTLTANECLTVTLIRRDGFGNPVPVSGAGAVTIAPPGPTLYDSANCTGAVGVPVSASSFSRTFSLRSSVAAPSTLYTLTMDGQTAQLTLTINPGPTSKLLVEGLPPTLAARGCAGPITVRRQDADNNNVTGEPSLAVSLSSARFSFSGVAGCAGATTGASVTIANGSAVSAEPLYATATQAGAALATANATAPGGPVTGSASTTITAGPATKLFFLDPPPGPVASGVCSGTVVTSRVELRDLDDNPVTPGANVTVTLGSSPGTPTFNTGSTCASALPLVLTTAQRIGTFSFRPTTAPSTETITATSGVLTPATQDWTINVAAPTKMAWKQGPVTPAARFTCVSAGIIQTQDLNNNVSANQGATITVTPTPLSPTASGMTFFSDSGCTAAISTLTIANGASETAEFFMLATGATPVNLSATSSPALTAPPVRPVALTGTGSYAVTPPTPALEAGACVALTVERRDATATAFIKGTSSVNLSVPTANPALATLHLLADCSDAAATLPLNRVIADGASTTTVYVRGRSAAPSGGLPVDVVFSAADALGGTGASASGTTTLKVYPLVRRGACNLTATTATARCAVSPSIPGDVIARSFLVFSSTGSVVTTGPPENRPSDQNVECHLENTTGVEVVCSRATSLLAVNVNYQVVSFGRDAASLFGVSVQRATFQTTAATTTATLTTPVNTAKSFILASSTMSGNDNNGDAFPLVKFASTGPSVSNVDVVANTATPTRTVSIEVVTLGFATAAVEHVNNTNPTQTSGGYSIGTGTTAVGSTFALAMAQVSADSTDMDYMCKRRLNVKVAASAVTMHRGGVAAPSANCTTDAVVATTVQRVTVGNGVVRVPASDAFFNSNNTATMNTGTFAAVAPHKAITFLMMQGPGGQTAGESDFASSAADGDDTGAFHALLDFNAGGDRVSVTRTILGSNNTAVFSPIVVQFDP